VIPRFTKKKRGRGQLIRNREHKGVVGPLTNDGRATK
jgi:hypothetical protein